MRQSNEEALRASIAVEAVLARAACEVVIEPLSSTTKMKSTRAEGNWKRSHWTDVDSLNWASAEPLARSLAEKAVGEPELAFVTADSFVTAMSTTRLLSERCT